MSAPLLLSATVTLPASGSAVADSGALSSPFRGPIALDEVRWTVSIPTPGPNFFALDMGAVVRTKMSMGRVDVTKDFVPIWLFGTAMQASGLVEAETDGIFGAPTPISFSHYRWKLPKPLIIPAGSVLRPQFQRINDLIPGNATVLVSYAGRYMDPDEKVPDEIDVPWVTAYLPTDGVPFVQSSERDLVNTFLTPLNVQRLIFRAFRSSATSVAEGFSPAQVIVQDSHGVNIIRDFLSPSSAFDSARRSWTFQRVLNPKERYNVTFSGGTPNGGGFRNFLQLAMIGWRKEVFA